MNELLEIALSIASTAHKGQVDKGGQAYIMHPIRVMGRCKTDEERIVSLLHDTVEDTEVSLDELEKKGFSREIIDAIESVTRKKDESYREFIVRASKNPIGKQVKIHDLEDNMDITRLDSLSDKDARRLNKYIHSYRYLTCNDSNELDLITE